MAAAKLKAQCLSVMDEVQAKREPVAVTKNGRPVAIRLIAATAIVHGLQLVTNDMGIRRSGEVN